MAAHLRASVSRLHPYTSPIVEVTPLSLEDRRRQATTDLDRRHRSTFGQFFTPAPVAKFMASLVKSDGSASMDVLDLALARGLCAYLNSQPVDDYFRTFSGHTQVNATDLRRLCYPPQDQLRAMGELSGEEG